MFSCTGLSILLGDFVVGFFVLAVLFFFFKAISSVCVKANVHLQEKEKNNICRSLLGSSLSFFETATVLTE